MATERWDDARLDRLADVVEANAESIRELRSTVSQVITTMEVQQQANIEVFQAIVQELRGIRTEQRRILNHLFGE